MILLSLIIPALLFLGGGFYFSKQNSKMHNLSAMVLTIAGVVYTLMAYIYFENPDVNLRQLRYIDWAFTVPIMLYQISIIANSTKSNTIYTIICALVMLSIGFLGEIGGVDKMTATFLGILCALFIFVPLLNNIDYRINEILYLTLIGWLFYPIVYMFADTAAIIYSFSIVDLSVKLGLSYYLYKKLV